MRRKSYRSGIWHEQKTKEREASSIGFFGDYYSTMELLQWNRSMEKPEATYVGIKIKSSDLGNVPTWPPSHYVLSNATV